MPESPVSKTPVAANKVDANVDVEAQYDPKSKPSKFAIGERVIVTKEGSQTGKTAVVSDANWNGRVKVAMDCDGDITIDVMTGEEVIPLPHGEQPAAAGRPFRMFDPLTDVALARA